MKNKKFNILLILFILFPSLIIVASTADKKVSGDISEISLEDLLNTDITVAGKKAQKINEAPAIVSVITDEDIYHMGASSLYEVLSTIPGINVTETYFGYTAVNIRGSLQTHYNNKSLLLLNNHPIFDSILGSYYLEQIPLTMIKRIEIIRGPGSTLYGTNAFTGVIKIITKEGKDLDGGEVRLTAGSFKTINSSFVYGKAFKDFQLSIAGNFMDSKGWPYKVSIDEDHRSGQIDYEDDYYNGMISIGYKNLKANLSYFHVNKDKFGTIPTLVSTGYRKIDGFSGDLSYDFTPGEKTSFSIYAYYDSIKGYEETGWVPPQQILKDMGIGEEEDMKSKNSKAGVEFQGTYKFSDKTHLVGGLLYESLHTNPMIQYIKGTDIPSPFGSSPFFDSHNSYAYSGYLQLDSVLGDIVGVVAGIRYTYDKDFGSKIVPRGGLVFYTSDKIHFKMLYGQAFRSPNFFEKYTEGANILYGNPDLNPEQINTLDFGMDYMINSQNNLRINYFFTTTDNLITRSGIVKAGERGNTKDTPQYQNSDGQRINGLEIEFKGALLKKFRYFANASYIEGVDKKNEFDIGFIPTFISNLGFSIKFYSKGTFSTNLQYTGKRSGKLFNKTDYTVDPYFLWNATVSYDPTKSLTLRLIGKNLTNSNYFVPEYIRGNIPEIPGGPGRAFYIQALYDF